jgi:hypothetical protein
MDLVARDPPMRHKRRCTHTQQQLKVPGSTRTGTLPSRSKRNIASHANQGLWRLGSTCRGKVGFPPAPERGSLGVEPASELSISWYSFSRLQKSVSHRGNFCTCPLRTTSSKFTGSIPHLRNMGLTFGQHGPNLGPTCHLDGWPQHGGLARSNTKSSNTRFPVVFPRFLAHVLPNLYGSCPHTVLDPSWAQVGLCSAHLLPYS